MQVSEREVEILRNSLGIKYISGKWTEPYRNRFCPGQVDKSRCDRLTSLGLMSLLSEPTNNCSFFTYQVTDYGIEVANSNRYLEKKEEPSDMSWSIGDSYKTNLDIIHKENETLKEKNVQLVRLFLDLSKVQVALEWKNRELKYFLVELEKKLSAQGGVSEHSPAILKALNKYCI